MNSAHCNYSSQEQIGNTEPLTLSIQFIDSAGIPGEYTSSGNLINLISEFSAVIPAYGNFDFSTGSTINIGLSEYQIISGYFDDGVNMGTLSFIQSNCIDLPQQNSIITASSTGTTKEFMDFQSFADISLVEVWMAWLLMLISTMIYIFKTIKYETSN